jgi:hypothetical protein
MQVFCRLAGAPVILMQVFCRLAGAPVILMQVFCRLAGSLVTLMQVFYTKFVDQFAFLSRLIPYKFLPLPPKFCLDFKGIMNLVDFKIS